MGVFYIISVLIWLFKVLTVDGGIWIRVSITVERAWAQAAAEVHLAANKIFIISRLSRRRRSMLVTCLSSLALKCFSLRLNSLLSTKLRSLLSRASLRLTSERTQSPGENRESACNERLKRLSRALFLLVYIYILETGLSDIRKSDKCLQASSPCLESRQVTILLTWVGWGTWLDETCKQQIVIFYIIHECPRYTSIC